MPGVQVSTGPSPSAADLVVATGADYFVVGQCERGSATEIVTATSMTDARNKIGQRVTYGALDDDLDTFFAEGGKRVRIARVVGPAATTGLLSLVDRAGTPVATLSIAATSPGPWSSRVAIAITAGAIPNTFNVEVYLDGDTTTPVEVFPDLLSPAAAVTALLSSTYVRATNLASVSAAPNNNPALQAPTALSAGSDDRGSLVATSYTDALARFGRLLGPGAVGIPGQASSAVGAAVIAHCKANNRIAILAAAVGSTSAAAITAATALRNTAGSEGAGLFWPWVRIPDGSGGERVISPEGYVAGCRARTIAAIGPEQPPAGIYGQAQRVTRPDVIVSRAVGDDLNSKSVNCIRTIGLSSTRIYGWRSLSADQRNYPLLRDRDLMNFCASTSEGLLEDLVFRVIDAQGHFAADAIHRVMSVVGPINDRGGLSPYPLVGPPIDPGYVVNAGPEINTPDTLARNEFHIQLGIRPAGVAEMIWETITKVLVNQALV
ncbi:MAG: hypothetical protein M3256_12305 [Actinomycetota bacterium]|nr:hypothetical protein [Actinomycetota bacterium]